MLETVPELIQTDRQMSLRMMDQELKIGRETIRRILVEDLGERKICARFHR
jgi:hypothetical protein